MSGVELALASIPLAIAAYQAISPFLKGVFQFSKAVDTILGSLRIQQTIFNADVKFLLLLVTESPDVTKQMLEDPGNYNWKSRKFNLKLHQLLGDSTEICVQTGREIQNSLEILNEKLSDLSGHSLDGSRPEKNTGKLASRIVFALSSNIEENAQKVQVRVQNFHTMVDQALREARHQSKLQKKPMIISDEDEGADAIGAFRAVQGAASSLHEALCSACTKHISHTVHLCLRSNREPNQVRFRISFNKEVARISSDHSWLIIKSVHKGAGVTSPSGYRLKRQHSNDHIETRKSAKIPTPHLVRRSGGRNGQISPSLVGNLCTIVQATVKPVKTYSVQCLGRLQEAELYTHRVYIDNPPLCGVKNTAPVPLSKLKPPSHSDSTTKSSDRVSLSLFNRVQLAKELAVAVLNLHNTPWLDSWRSENIIFYAPGTDTPKPKYHIPLANTFLSTNVGDIRTDPKRIETSNLENKWCRNSVLFRLAVMLLELAFEAPLKDLQSSEDEIRGKTQAGAEYVAARRLCQQSAGRVDKRYKNVIEKCLYCDFGCGDDLNQADLQEAFSSRVIGELKRLEKDIKKLEIV